MSFCEDTDNFLHDDVFKSIEVLAKAYEDLNSSHVSDFLFWYQGPWEGVDYMLGQVFNCGNIQDNDAAMLIHSTIQNAVRHLGRGRFEWGAIIRGLIRDCDVDLHAPIHHVNRTWRPIRFEQFRGGDDVCWEYGTALEALCSIADTPHDANIVGAAWLDILSSEDIDTKLYLEREIWYHENCQRADVKIDHGLRAFEIQPARISWR